MVEPLVVTSLKNLKGIPIVDGVYLDKKLYLTSSQFFYESGILPPSYRIKYMWIIVSSNFNLVSRDIDIKFFNSFKTIIEIDSGICKYLYQYKNAFMLILSKILRLKYADLFFRVKECMFISGNNSTLLSLRQEINEKTHTQRVLDTLPTLFTVVKLTFYNLFNFVNHTLLLGNSFITKKNRYYKAPYKVVFAGYFIFVKNNVFRKKIYKKRLQKTYKNSLIICVQKFAYRNKNTSDIFKSLRNTRRQKYSDIFLRFKKLYKKQQIKKTSSLYTKGFLLSIKRKKLYRGFNFKTTYKVLDYKIFFKKLKKHLQKKQKISVKKRNFTYNKFHLKRN